MRKRRLRHKYRQNCWVMRRIFGLMTEKLPGAALCLALSIPAWWLGKLIPVVGVGSSICGGSAIAATAPVIGADDEEFVQCRAIDGLRNPVNSYKSAFGLSFFSPKALFSL